MSNIMLRLVQRTICLTLFYLGWTLLVAAAGRTNITGTWNLDQLENDKSDQKAHQIVGSRADLTDSVADQRDQLETARGIPNAPILLMMAGSRARVTLPTGGRAEKFQGGIQGITRWVNDALFIVTVSPQASTKTIFVPGGG